MRDEARVRELVAPALSRPVDIDGKRFKVNRERIISAILRAPADIEAARVSPARWRTMVAMAAGFAALVGSAAWFAHRTLPRAPSPDYALRLPRAPSADYALSVTDVHGTVTRIDSGQGRSFSPGQAAAISADGELITAPQSEASLAAASGLSIKVFEKSRVSLAGLGTPSSTSVSLSTGDIRCHVPHLAERHTFSVITPDAIVVVHGTVFRVTVSGPVGATQTCVQVDEGLVGVQTASGETLVPANRSWGCHGQEPPASALAGVPSIGPSSNAIRPLAKERPAQPTGGPAGTLDQQNRLFQAGLLAERQGDTRAAGVYFEQLLSRYPASPLASDTQRALARVKRDSEHEK
jgi:hypothetical protein